MQTEILYMEKPVTEYEAVKLISEGAKVSEFSRDTILMNFAAVTYQKDGAAGVPEQHWSKRLAKYAVRKDFHNLRHVSDMMKNACTGEFFEASGKLGRDALTEWKTILNDQTPEFLNRLLRENPQAGRYLEKDKMNRQREALIEGNLNSRKGEKTISPMFVCPKGRVGQDIDEESVMTPDRCLSLPDEEKTEELFVYVLSSDAYFPETFLRTILIPNRNQARYKKEGDLRKAEEEKKHILPYVTKDVALKIARLHPEGAIRTPKFLTRDAVSNFFRKMKNRGETEEVFRKYFNDFPAEVLSQDMIETFTPDLQSILHAPELYKGTGTLKKYLRRHPYHILNMPESIQNEDDVMRDGVPLNKRTIKGVKNDELRKTILLAMNGFHPVKRML